MDNRMRFRTQFDISPAMGRKLVSLLEGVRDKTPEMERVLRQIRKGHELQASRSTEFLLVHAPRPIGRWNEFDDWMQHRRHGIQPYPFPLNKTGRVHIERAKATLAFFVVHRKARMRVWYYAGQRPAFFYDDSAPVFHTLDLTALEVAYGPYAGLPVVDVFEDPGVFVVRTRRTVVRACSHRKTIVYATWVARVAQVAGEERKRRERAV